MQNVFVSFRCCLSVFRSYFSLTASEFVWTYLFRGLGLFILYYIILHYIKGTETTSDGRFFFTDHLLCLCPLLFDSSNSNEVLQCVCMWECVYVFEVGKDSLRQFIPHILFFFVSERYLSINEYLFM